LADQSDQTCARAPGQARPGALKEKGGATMLWRIGKPTAAAALALGAILSLGLGGCNNAVQGGATGAGLGALAGMGLGSLGGHMGNGAAAGAIIGGIGGAILGDQNARRGGSLDY